MVPRITFAPLWGRCFFYGKKEKKMKKTRNLTQSAILLAIGTILHLIPGIVSGVKPDFMLVCVFLAIMLEPDFTNALVTSLAGGLLAAATTNMPGGQIPNIIDKLIAGLFVYLLVKTFLKGENAYGKKGTIIKGALFFLGTLLSGVIFLSLVSAMVGLPGGASLTSLIMAIVLPTALINILVGLIFDKAATKTLARRLAY